MALSVKRRMLICAAIIIVAMLAIPWAAVEFAAPDAGRALSIMMLFVIDPLAAIAVGALSADRHMRFMPLVCSAAYIAGAYLFMGARQMDAAFWRYAAVYLALGLIAMLISMAARRRAGE